MMGLMENPNVVLYLETGAAATWLPGLWTSDDGFILLT